MILTKINAIHNTLNFLKLLSFCVCLKDNQRIAWLGRFAKILKEDSNEYAVICAARQLMKVVNSLFFRFLLF